MVFPEPFGPSKTMISFGLTVKSRFLSADVLPYCLVRVLVSTAYIVETPIRDCFVKINTSFSHKTVEKA